MVEVELTRVTSWGGKAQSIRLDRCELCAYRLPTPVYRRVPISVFGHSDLVFPGIRARMQVRLLDSVPPYCPVPVALALALL